VLCCAVLCCAVLCCVVGCGVCDDHSATPVIDSNGMIFVASDNLHVSAINPQGTVVFTVPVPVDVESLAIGAGQTLFVGLYDNSMFALR
jgi:hypothetical protein